MTRWKKLSLPGELSTGQVAALLDCSPKRVHRLVREGRLVGRKIGHAGQLRVDPVSMRRFLLEELGRLEGMP